LVKFEKALNNYLYGSKMMVLYVDSALPTATSPSPSLINPVSIDTGVSPEEDHWVRSTKKIKTTQQSQYLNMEEALLRKQRSFTLTVENISLPNTKADSSKPKCFKEAPTRCQC
ncbi:hypothetical protein U1Q18_014815, partial [Sarracenia purpurea var. burkii]